MAAAFSINVTGDKEVQKLLFRLDNAVQRKIMRKAIKGAAKMLEDRVWAKAPRMTGRLADKLRVVPTKRSRTGFGMYVRTPTREELGIDSTGDSYYPAAQEFGTSRGLRALRYMKGTAEAYQDRIVSMVQRDFARAIKAEARKSG